MKNSSQTLSKFNESLSSIFIKCYEILTNVVKSSRNLIKCFPKFDETLINVHRSFSQVVFFTRKCQNMLMLLTCIEIASKVSQTCVKSIFPMVLPLPDLCYVALYLNVKHNQNQDSVIL